MAIQLTCACGRKLKIQDEFAGQEGQCPACGATLLIPFPDEQANTQPAFAAAAAAQPEPTADPEVRTVAKRRERQEELLNHCGRPLPVNGDYFVEAPAAIGSLTSAYTTLRKGQRPWSSVARTLLCVVATGSALCFGILCHVLFDLGLSFWGLVWLLGAPAGALALTLRLTRFLHTCTYVGDEGVARFVWTGTRGNVSNTEIFLFRDATHLRTSQTLHYHNGVYQHTSYKYIWTDVGGQQRFEINGTHNSKKGTPPPTHEYHFARAAELAWTLYLLDLAQRQIELAGSVAFPLKGGLAIRLCPGRIIFQLNDEDPLEWAAEEVGAAVIQKGTVKIKRVDAQEGWFSSTGVIKFPFDNLANAQLFFHLFNKFIGVEIR